MLCRLWFDSVAQFRDVVPCVVVETAVTVNFLAGHANIHCHLDYIAYLIDRRKWLAGDFLSLADLAAAAHLSTVDYIGDVPWKDHEGAKNWYSRVKSRPSFRTLLEDNIPGAPPSKHYRNLDF